MGGLVPNKWIFPKFPLCPACGRKGCMKPIILRKKRSVNWLFLFLAGMLNCCSIHQLMYFCKHTGNHMFVDKARLIYLTCFELCKQLDPQFDVKIV
ncbi:hypothetical protein QJS04_geneDACA015457 [Acorus gramineus]|uniref:DUF7086 domain-containing protein n=1 Tax=Acorus gramineus TaxID=55184 RepID=A0AAV9A4M1_ACOGR|nr:hypothetical protein QJS04_geneDACA015457 [Acorus gramineus]